MTARTILRISEAQWQSRVVDYATLRGWKSWHNADSRRTQAGVLDLMLIRPPRLVFMELKAEHGRVRPEQARMVDLLRDCRVEAYIFRPSDWDQVMAVLR